MALLQISEPGHSPAPHLRKRAAGIDLGTTHSLIATVRSGTPVALADVDGEVIMPSAVRYLASGEALVGTVARQEAAEDPLNTLVSVKRFMGRGLQDVASLGGSLPYQFVSGDGMVCIQTVAGAISPVQASAEILKTLAERAKAALDGELDGVVITVPAYFDDAQRQATKDAAVLAGLKVMRLLNEPTAAAVAYGLDRSEEGVIAVYDLGGGTFDISILRLSRGVFEVLATGGDSALGGDDFDAVLAEWVLQQANIASLDFSGRRTLLDHCREAKEALSSQSSVSLHFGDWSGVITRSQYDLLIEGLVERSVRSCRKVLRDAKLSAEDIAHIVMVGGSTRCPYVRETIGKFFKQIPLTDIDPDCVVALGAAIQADQLVGNRPDNELLLLDVIPLSLGIETMGGLVEKIISRNTTIPVAKAQEFTTFRDGQTAMAIHVVQGERELVSDCRSLARFELRGIPPMVAGAAHIRVTFQVDADGLLNVFAQETSSGVEASITVKPSYGLGDGEIARMLQESFAHAKEDMQARRLNEQRVDARRMVENLRSALQADGALLDQKERDLLHQLLSELEQKQSDNDSAVIAEIVERASRDSEFFAARRMNVAVQKALAGKSIHDLSDADNHVASNHEGG
ncbi:MAG TPA: Fe-S protein assembly chaperone HscA [Pseudomonadales bacterium]|nr:Fe-S protein assembly chaperone HscA [Pseudomonadales bacterium]